MADMNEPEDRQMLNDFDVLIENLEKTVVAAARAYVRCNEAASVVSAICWTVTALDGEELRGKVSRRAREARVALVPA